MIGGKVVIIKLIQESGNDTLRDLGRQQYEQHFVKLDGPKVQMVNVGIRSKAG